jgi:hypothetical protein
MYGRKPVRRRIECSFIGPSLIAFSHAGLKLVQPVSYQAAATVAVQRAIIGGGGPALSTRTCLAMRQRPMCEDHARPRTLEEEAAMMAAMSM